MIVPTPAFDPAKHGFHFSNNEIDWELHPGGPRGKNLCGGMVYAALDFFLANQPIPPDTTPPAVRTKLNSYIYDRQLTAHKNTLFRFAGEIMFSWLNRDRYWVNSLASEFDKLTKILRANRPVPIFIFKEGFSFPDVGNNAHHVLAIECQNSSSAGQPIMRLYDPNCPNQITEMHADYRLKRFRMTGFGFGKPVWQGFYVEDNYSPQIPPADLVPPSPLPGPTPPAPGPVPPVPPTPPSPVPPAPSGLTHTVKRGENLSLIAKRYYGDERKWRKIYDEPNNRAVIGPNPNLIYPGQVLVIPA